MGKINRQTQYVFGSNAEADLGLTEFASTANNDTQFIPDPTDLSGNNVESIQTAVSISPDPYYAWEGGWLKATLDTDKRLPTYQDMNSVHYVCTAQLAYLFQEGIPEWDAQTPYYHYSIVKIAGTFQLYGCITTGPVVSATSPVIDTTNWQFLIDFNNRFNIPCQIKTSNYIVSINDIGNLLEYNSESSGTFTLLQPFTGGYYFIKNINSGVLTIAVSPSGTAEITSLQQNQAVFFVADTISNEWRVCGRFDNFSTQQQATDGTDTSTMISPSTLHGTFPVYYMPSGAVTAYAGTSAPPGYLMCDGSSQLIASYPALSAIIRVTFGGSDPSHFYLPNLNNGSFIRGLGGNSGAIGISQGDAIRNITGTITSTQFGNSGSVAYSGAITATASTLRNPNDTGNAYGLNIGFNASLSVPTASENRPLNMALNYIIKT